MKKFSYFMIVLFIVGTNAFGIAAEDTHSVASHIATSFPESGSLAVLGSILISGATLLRRKLSARTK